MQAHIDGDLKLELPEEVVRRLRLRPNSTVELSVQDDKMVLELEPEEAVLVKVGNVWVAQTQHTEPEDAPLMWVDGVLVADAGPLELDLNDFIEQMREERIRELGGW